MARSVPTAAHYLQGQSPRARGREKQANVLEWVYCWGFSTAEIIRKVAGQKANGYAKFLTDKGLLRATRTASGVPRDYYTLTETGLQEAVRETSQDHPYVELDPYRLKQAQIRHYRLAQLATIGALENDLIEDFQTERMLGRADAPGVKRPDVIWEVSDNTRWAVEIELSGKWGQKMDEFVSNIYSALRSGTYERFCIVTDSPALEVRYRNAIQEPSVPVWQKTSKGVWEKVDMLRLPSWLPQKVNFQLIEG